MTKVVSLKAVRELKKAQKEDPSYQVKILAMGKLELLEEMMRFQEKRSHLGTLTFEMMIQGQILFSALEANAETEELKSLASSYQKHLRFELEELLNGTQTRSNDTREGQANKNS